MEELPSISSNGEEHLECDECHDESLYHDAIAYYNGDTDHLLCPECYGKKKCGDVANDGYKKVLTWH